MLAALNAIHRVWFFFRNGTHQRLRELQDYRLTRIEQPPPLTTHKPMVNHGERR